MANSECKAEDCIHWRQQDTSEALGPGRGDLPSALLLALTAQQLEAPHSHWTSVSVAMEDWDMWSLGHEHLRAIVNSCSLSKPPHCPGLEEPGGAVWVQNPCQGILSSGVTHREGVKPCTCSCGYPDGQPH